MYRTADGRAAHTTCERIALLRAGRPVTEQIRWIWGIATIFGQTVTTVGYGRAKSSMAC
jgi:hypothetical protein